jgi:eukaryotic-like serine/threonine-protein kinase
MLPPLPAALAPSGPVVLEEAEPSVSQPLRDPRLRALPKHLEPLRLLGQGGSSVVYEVLHTRLKVKVALKLLTIDGPHAEQAQKRMLREANLYALLDDPRIPRVYDVNELPDGTPYVVMEMVPGESLEDLLAARGALSPEHAIATAREVLLALASVHERDVLHRDVKPANVILKFDQHGPSEVRLVDFGIAKMSRRGAGEEAVTQRGTLIGTPHYMAAECLAGHPANASTDVYAVGIMLYEMLAGAVPFTGPSLVTIMAAVMREVPKTLEERGIAVAPELSRLVMKAIAREPNDRFASARDMLAALDALQPERASIAHEVVDTARPRARRRGRFWFLAALFSILLISTGFLLAGARVAPHAQEPTSATAATEPSTAPSLPRASFPTAPTPLSLERRAPPLLDPIDTQGSEAKHRHRARSSDSLSPRERARERERAPYAPDNAQILPANPY